MSKLVLIIATISFLITGCSKEPELNNPENELNPSISVSGENTNSEEEIIDENASLKNEFDILKYMTDDENYMVSPFSLKMAMALAANGAEGETQKEILDAFGIENLEAYNNMARDIIREYSETDFVKLNIANSIWLNKDIAGNAVFKDSYKKLIKEYFDGMASEENANEFGAKINSWVENKTNNKIKDLVDGQKVKDSLAVLVNAIYFKGEWADKFDVFATNKETFTNRDGKTKDIDFMHKTERRKYYEDENMKMVSLPYEGGKTSMYVVLPENEEKMDITSALENMTSYKVKLALPKFRTEYDLSFEGILKKVNVSKAFEKREAEFKDVMFENILPEENVYIEDVIQKTFIDVDENGTEAAAATAVILNKATAIMPTEEEIKEFKADRPFIYFIRDEETKQILFIGEYAYAD